MVMLKTIEAHTGGCVDVQDYLEREGRAEAIAVSPSIGDPSKWAERMDAHRRRAGKDFGRKWYHFVLSPDPADYPTVDDVMALARDWVEQNYPGREWAVAIHADNEHEVRHAHVILNAYDPVTGGKIQRSNAKVRDEWDSCQLLGQAHGMTPLESLPLSKRTTARSVVYTRAEREMLAKGIVPYKEAIRRAVSATAPECRDFAEFRRRLLREHGIEAKRTRRGVTYRDAKGRAAKDAKLGDGCTIAGLNERFAWRAPMSGFATDWVPSVAPCVPPSPVGFAAALQRRARRRGVRDAKALAEIVALVSGPEASGRACIEARVAEAAGRVREAQEALSEAEGALYRLAVAVSMIDAYRRTQAAYEGYVSAGAARTAFARSHERELSLRADAEEWLEPRGLTGEAAQAAVLHRFAEADGSLPGVAARLEAAKDSLRAAKRLAEVYEQVTRPDGIVKPTTPKEPHEPKKGNDATVLEKEVFALSAFERAQRASLRASASEARSAFAVEAERRRLATMDERAEKAVEAAREAAQGLGAAREEEAARFPHAKRR